MAVSSHIRTAFAKVKEFESETDANERRNIQLKHLLAIADHEQGVILQPLIYEDKDFADWLKIQRSAWVNWASPNLELVFASECGTGNDELKSVAPKATEMEDLRSRMSWIGKAAERFHLLMHERPAYMEGELQKMAGWVGLSDA